MSAESWAGMLPLPGSATSHYILETTSMLRSLLSKVVSGIRFIAHSVAHGPFSLAEAGEPVNRTRLSAGAVPRPAVSGVGTG